MITVALIAFGFGLTAGIVGTTYAAKKGWIQPANIEPLK